VFEFVIQVLSEYPEAKLTSEQQYASLGESYIELVHKLDEGIPSKVQTIHWTRNVTILFSIINYVDL